jgi:hypothetical protein
MRKTISMLLFILALAIFVGVSSLALIGWPYDGGGSYKHASIYIIFYVYPVVLYVLLLANLFAPAHGFRLARILTRLLFVLMALIVTLILVGYFFVS